MAWMRAQRWFGAKDRQIRHAAEDDRVLLGPGTIRLLSLELDDGTRQRYAVAVVGADATPPTDALDDPAFCRALLGLIESGGRLQGHHGELVGERTAAFPGGLPADVSVQRVGGEQSNTSVIFGRAVILKHFRRLQEGINPEAEITRFLTERTGFRHTPRLAGQLVYQSEGRVSMLGIVEELVPGARDGWEWMLERLAEFYGRLPTRGGPADPTALSDLAGESLAALRRLGACTGELHRALASDPTEPAFAPEPIVASDIADWAAAVRRQLEDACQAARRVLLDVERVEIIPGLEGLRQAVKIRHHGDLHLGQILRRGDTGDFAIIDFEGEPLRPLAERRRKHAAIRDVAGMLRSIDYASVSAPGAAIHTAWAEAWTARARGEFVAAYRSVTEGKPFVPASSEAFARALAVFELEKAAYEVVYEANNRPEWIAIPIRGVLRASAALGRQPGAGAA